MAAYTSTVTLAHNKAERISRSWALIPGTIDITGYNATTTEETDITKHFKAYTVGGATVKCFLIMESTTDNGYTLEFNHSSGKFKAYREAGTGSGARTEASTDDDVGASQFLAVGMVAGR